MVSESRVTWAIPVPILVFLGLSVLDVGPMYTTDRRQTDVRQTDVRQEFQGPGKCFKVERAKSCGDMTVYKISLNTRSDSLAVCVLYRLLDDKNFITKVSAGCDI